jgi:hypothetical protein
MLAASMVACNTTNSIMAPPTPSKGIMNNNTTHLMCELQ